MTSATTLSLILKAILVLVASLLLGYVLYSALISNQAATVPNDEMTTEDVSVTQERQYTDAEKDVILKAINDEDLQAEISVEEESQRRAELETMNDVSEDDVIAPAEREATLRAMQ